MRNAENCNMGLLPTAQGKGMLGDLSLRLTGGKV
jgi:hypothetical protein